MFKLAVLFGTSFFTSMPASANTQPWLIPFKSYVQLTGSERLEYSRQIREAFSNFEVSVNRKMKFASYSRLSLIEQANAANESVCPIGGILRSLVNGLCPTYGRPCAGQADGFRCGKIYGNACIARIPIDTISQRCGSASSEGISESSYREVKSVYDKSLDKVCTKPSSSRFQDQCKAIKNRLNDLNEKYTHREEPKPPKKDTDPVKDDKESFTTTPGDTCSPTRNQGGNGTCHAFCLTCVYDKALKAKTGKKSRISANWLSMLSVVDRLCDDDLSKNLSSDEILRNGWHPDRNLNLLSAVGACQESNYLPYSSQEGTDWISGFAKENSYTRGLNSRREGFDDQHWKQQFGLTSGDAYDLFCPSPKTPIEDELSGYPERLEDLKSKGRLSERFYNCAKEALQNAKRLSNGPPRFGSCTPTRFSNDSVNDLRKALKNGRNPIPVVIQTDTAGHQFHCVTATGFDDAKQAFSLTNSWGSNTQYNSLSYANSNQLVQHYPTDCVFGSNNSEANSGSSSNSGKGEDGAR